MPKIMPPRVSAVIKNGTVLLSKSCCSGELAMSFYLTLSGGLKKVSAVINELFEKFN
jgi:hypothetical protein